MKFSDVAIGDECEIGRSRVLKVSPREYFVLAGPSHRVGFTYTTAANTNVNGPSGDEASAVAQKRNRDQLNAIAKAAGYENWSQLQTGALAGAEIRINERGGG